MSTGRPQEPRATPQHNLPASRSSFIGREQEMLEVEQALAKTRLVTLTGTGGSGKTRLALEVARRVIEAYPDGVWLVELAPLSEEALIPKAVAEALQVPERPQVPLNDTLVDAVRPKRVLVVLDNCEHLVGAVASLVDLLLDSCPHLRMLATSREALGVEGEVVWRVPPLTVPDPEHSPTLEELEGSESARLLLARARNRDRSFAFTPENVRSVAEICKSLEGIPLAIELAAARLGTLSLEQISGRLGDSLELLTRGRRTSVARQRTLRGTLDWSHDLLSEPERALFRRLSVFAGGCTLGASGAVGSGGRVDEARVLDLLSALVEKSLVVAGPTAEGEVRHRLLEPIRQYALKRLEDSGEAESVRQRHASFFLAMAEGAEGRLWGPDEAAWVDRLETEHDNLRTALLWAVQRQEGELALRLAGALGYFWQARGYLSEGRRWTEEALENGGRSSARVRAKALQSTCWLASSHGDFDRARSAAEEGLRLSDEAGIGGVVAATFKNTLGEVAANRGEYDLAMELHEEGLRLCREAKDERQVAFSLLVLGNTSVGRGDIDRAKRLYEEGLALSRELGGARPLAAFLVNLGLEYLLEGDHERATELSEEAVEVYREHRHRGHLQYALDNLGWAALLRGDRQNAKAYHMESLKLCKELGDRFIAVESMEGLACAVGAEGEAAKAARLLGAAEAQRNTIGYQRTPRDNALRRPYPTAVRSALGETAWEAALAEGKTMGLEEAIDYALAAGRTSATTPASEEASASTSEDSTDLTSRELEVLKLVASGMTSAQVAKELFLSPRTVDTHLTSIYRKLGVRSRAAAIRFALEHDLA